MIKKSEPPKILLDADIIIHFIKADKILYLPKIYHHRLLLLDVVESELLRYHSMRKYIENLTNRTGIELITFPDDIEIIKEYSYLTDELGKGEGESACLAVAKHKKYIIASSNLKDIKKYCLENGIIYFTTMDVLVEAWKKGIMSEEECDDFIRVVRDKGSHLPCYSIQEYLQKKE